MHADPYAHGEDPDATTSSHTPGDEPDGDTPKTPQRRPIVAFFRRRAFFSQETGRWHNLTGGREHRDDGPSDGSRESDPR